MKRALMNCYWSTVAVHLCMWLQRHRSLGAKNERSMEKGTRKKQRRNRSHWKKYLYAHLPLPSYCTSSQVIHLGFGNTYHSGLSTSQIVHKFQFNVVITAAKKVGKGWKGSGDKKGKPSAWSLSLNTKNAFVSKLSSPAVVDT